MFLVFIFCTCFLLTDTFAFIYNHNNNNLNHNNLNKRQAVPSRTCGNQPNSVSICSPTYGSIWTNDTDQEITWKYNNPKLNLYQNLDLYLLYQPTEGSYTNIKNWTHLETAKGTLVAHVDDSWYPEPIKDNALNKSWSMYFFIVGADEDYQAQLTLIPSQLNFFPGPQVFTLLQIARNTTTTIPTQSSNPLPDSPRNVPVTNNSSDTSKKLPGWAIAVIVISSLLFIAAVAALIWAYKRYQKRSKRRSMMALGPNITTGDDEKLPVLTPTKNESHVAASTSINAAAAAAGTAGLLAAAASATKSRSGADISSIHSSTQQLWSPRSLSPRQDEVSFSSEKPPLGLHSEAHQSSSILSSTDALMIADTFRQFMRKPEWNEEMELNAQQQKEEKGGSEEEERKRLGDELLVRQLKKEGTQVKEINKFN